MKTKPQLIPLPIDPIIPELRSALEASPCLVLKASPGSGKTTRVPPALLSSAFRGGSNEILVLEPRRLAAKYAAHRVAEEMDEPVGKTVGYQFRFERVGGPETRLRFLTEGILTRRLVSDPELKGVAAVVLDEFHERHLHGDLALAYLRHLQQTKRPELRIVVMSATLDTEAVATYLGNCPVLRVESPVYPIEIEHLLSPSSRQLELTVKEAVQKALAHGNYAGDVLAFLPGMADIRRAQQALESLSRPGLEILPLHGELSREEQDHAIRKGKARKVILSTNVAETSLTIPGLSVVIDSGLHRQASYSWWSGVPALKTRPISRASAIQRAGRAGRTGPGLCLRLYTQGDFSSRPPFETPEISRADLTQTVLELKSLGVRSLREFPWFEKPSEKSLDAAVSLLYLLGAVGSHKDPSTLTELGHKMVRMPLHPRLARLMIEAAREGVAEDAATLAALVSEGELDRLDALSQLSGAARLPSIHRARTQFLSAVPPGGSKDESKNESDPAPKIRLEFAVLTGFPDRVARIRKTSAARAKAGEVELLFAQGGSAAVEESAAIQESDTFVVLDAQEQQSQGQLKSRLRVRSLLPISSECLLDLEPTLLEEKDETRWDSARERVTRVARLCYGEITLTEDELDPSGGSDPHAASKILLKNALGIDSERASQLKPEEWVAALGRLSSPESIESVLSRIQLVHQFFPVLFEGRSPETAITEGVLCLLEGHLRLETLRSIDWENALIGSALPGNSDRFEKLAPTHVTLSRGRRVKVQYKPGQPPWIESRLQDFFGMKKGPAILDGRQPLTLHLLAPNQRAVQVTTDLAGFWERGYKEQRHALSRRYPRHSWPEDPLA